MLKRLAICLFVGLCTFFVLSNRTHADELKIYLSGDPIDFRNSDNRLLCNSPEIIRDALVEIRSRLGAKHAAKVLWKPVSWKHGRANVNATIKKYAPKAARLIEKNCIGGAPDRVIIIAPSYMVRVGNSDVRVTLVTTTDKEMFATYFINVAIFRPFPGTEQFKLLQSIMAVLDAAHARR